MTAVVAHPADDRLFLSGSIEGRVRLWNVAEQRVVDDAAVHEMVSGVLPACLLFVGTECQCWQDSGRSSRLPFSCGCWRRCNAGHGWDQLAIQPIWGAAPDPHTKQILQDEEYGDVGLTCVY